MLLEFTIQNSSIAQPCRTHDRIIPLLIYSVFDFVQNRKRLLYKKDRKQNFFYGFFDDDK